MGKNTVEAKKRLDKRYGDTAPEKLTIIDWYAELKHGPANTDYAERSSRSKLYEKVVRLQFCTNLWGYVSFFPSGCRVGSHPTKNNNASRIQSAVWSCSSEVKRKKCCSTKTVPKDDGNDGQIKLINLRMCL